MKNKIKDSKLRKMFCAHWSYNRFKLNNRIPKDSMTAVLCVNQSIKGLEMKAVIVNDSI